MIEKLLMIAMLSAMIACNKSSNQSTVRSDSPVQTSTAKRYHLKGKVVSVDKQGKMAMIDSEAIPGFMEAMTMPYQVKPESQLDKLKAGDLVTADVVVQDDNGWLANIAVTGHSAPTSKP
jgi:protein SCO1/2